MKPEVFISYAWPETKSKNKVHTPLVDKICSVLEENNFKVSVDKKDVKYKDNIEKFEERLGKGDKIILIVSDKFLRSRHCMYEFLKIRERGNVNERIFPIVLSDANIYDPKEKLEYVKHWEVEIESLDAEIKKLKSNANIPDTSKTIGNYTEFRKIIEEIITLLGTMNTLLRKAAKDGA